MLQVHHFSKKLAGSTQIVDSVALSVQASRDQQNNSVKYPGNCIFTFKLHYFEWSLPVSLKN